MDIAATIFVHAVSFNDKIAVISPLYSRAEKSVAMSWPKRRRTLLKLLWQTGSKLNKQSVDQSNIYFL